MNHILIVEDEVKLRDELKLFLENNGLKVTVIKEFNNVVNDILNINPDLLLLDINLPNTNGEFICKELRKSTKLPIIIVTSKNTEIDELICLNYKADDFVTKPYSSQILLARINRLLDKNFGDQVISFKGLVLVISKSSIMKDNEIVLDLSKNEMKILFYLLKHQATIVSRDELIDYLWNDDLFIDDNTLTVNINRLRSKLDTLELGEIIVTKRGLGYMIL